MGFNSYDDMITKLTAGNKISTHISKARPAVAGVAQTFESWWQMSGYPAAGTYGGVALEAAQNNSTDVGAIPIHSAVSPLTAHLLTLGMQTSGGGNLGSILLYDRLLHYPNLNANTSASQTLSNPVALPRYTTGMGVMAFLEVTTNFGATASNFTMNYTKEDGTAGRTSTLVAMGTSSAQNRLPHTGVAANQFGPFIPLQAGDMGIRSVQSAQFSAAMGAGVAALVLAKPLAILPLPTATAMTERDFVFQLASMERIFDSACLGVLAFSGSAFTSSSNYQGYLEIGWG